MSLKFLLSTTFIVSAFAAIAQDGAKTYAITGEGNGDFAWKNVRQVDLNAGKMVKDIMVKNTAIKIFDGRLKKEVASSSLQRTAASNNLMAAAAFDKVHNKLFFAGMQTGELKWIDLNDKSAAVKVYTLQDTKFGASANPADEAVNVTRMCIGADGDGYAISNDGNHLYHFTTGKNVAIEDLGNLVDAEENQGISVHNKCTSWGGDMVADAYGKLYVVTANHNVFSVDITSRIAKFMGAIKGLPAVYSTNGAAVLDDDNLVVSSANNLEGFYKVNFNELTATKIEGSDKSYSASDLANGNLLFQTKANNAVVKNSLPQLQLLLKDTRVYPNPVTTNEFKVLFDGQTAGTYTIVLTDLAGRTLQSKSVTVTKANQAESIRLQSKPTRGMYLVKVLDAKGKTTLSDKVLVN